MNQTDKALLAMFRESTGSHFLDSGDAYGRHWQRNQKRDLLGEPAATVSFKYGSILFEHRTLHWLSTRVEFDSDVNDAFDGPFRESRGDDDPSWYELREEFPQWFARWRSKRDGETPCDCLGEVAGCEQCDARGVVAGDEDYYAATGIYGDGEPITVNTYNEENLLDQVLLFSYFELRTGPGRGGLEGAFIVLQVHGGCDVRGGYTRPRVFRVVSDEPVDLFDYRRGTVTCRGEDPHWWSTDDGSHWYFEGACGRGAGTQLEVYERHERTDGEIWEEGVLITTTEGKGLCPLCGAELEACL